MSRLPLEDITILSVEQYGAGPFGTLLLADLGASVIKVEDPATGGDIARYVPPYRSGEDSLYFEALNRGKRSISLDLASPAGQEVLHRLVADVDAVFCNLRGDVPEKLGLTYRQLSSINPRIVCCSLSAFGGAGSMRDRPGYDYLLQGMAGWMSLTGEPDAPPAKSGLSLVDFSSSFAAALAVVVGVHAARRDGVGSECDLALFDVAIGMLNYLGTWHLTSGFEPRRTANSAHPSLTPFQNLRAADGWFVVACAKEHFWVRLTEAFRRPDLRHDPRFATFEDRAEHAAELVDILQAIVGQQPREVVLDELVAAGVPCAPVLSVPEALAQPLVGERRMLVEYDHPGFGVVRSIASPVRIGETSAPPHRAPSRGQDTAEVLRSVAGISTDEIAEFEARGAFGAGRGEQHGQADDLPVP